MAENKNDTVISTSGLSIDYRIGKKWLNAIHDVSLTIRQNEIHGLVGESGSGKSTLGLAMIRYLADNARIGNGDIAFGDYNLAKMSDTDMSQVWGKLTSLVPQNPLDSLNPTLTIGQQMMEVTQWHLGLSADDAKKRAIEALEQVKIADPDQIIKRYPHQLSGGMQQRVMIAMALSTRPQLLVLDEPTTALDVTTQAVILDLVRDLIKQEQSAALYVSHDLGTIAQLCDRVTVLYGGEVMESGEVDTIFAKPIHPYTIGLLDSLPSSTNADQARLSTIEGVASSLAERSHACVFASRCPIAIDKCHQEKPPLETLDSGQMVRCWRWKDVANETVTPNNIPAGMNEHAPPKADVVLEATSMRKEFGETGLLTRLLGQEVKTVRAVDGVGIRVRGRSTLGIVGESGSGKTTLARVIVGLEEANDGEIRLLDVPISHKLNERGQDVMRDLRMIFQNPNDALNPYKTIGETIGRTFKKLSPEPLTNVQIQHNVIELLENVGLTGAYYSRYPNQLSGGEKQRVAIARAFAANPAVVVADEPTSALDVSVQATILNLLKDLRATEGSSYVIISHDLEVISYVADWIIVMYLGEIVEQGTTEQVYNIPSHPYTEALLSAIPLPDPTQKHGEIRLDGDVPSPRNKPTGCPFHTRCPRFIGDICVIERPPVRKLDNDHSLQCHHTLEDLMQMQTESEG